MLRSLALVVVLAGCPAAGPRYVVADVYAARQPLRDALVAAYCGTEAAGGVDAAVRTDGTGRARIYVPDYIGARQCRVIIAKPGYATATGAAAVCHPLDHCAPLQVDLDRPPAAVAR